MTAVSFSYAQARLHARLAARMTEPDWQQLEASLDFAHALELAGRMPVARWTQRLTRESGIHMVEEVLRRGLEADIEEVAGWLPQQWRPAATWFGLLPYLREREFAASAEARPSWLSASADPADGWDDPARAWRAEWNKRLARTGRAETLTEALAPILSRFLDTGGSRSWVDLERYFRKAFRSGLRGPVAVFAFISLDTLDSERLRGILVGQAIFAGGQ